MARLAETFAWAAEIVDLEPMRQAIRTAGNLPLRAIGSGGSLTGAHALADLHQRYTGHLGYGCYASRSGLSSQLNSTVVAIG